jgi:hypothetical protein
MGVKTSGSGKCMGAVFFATESIDLFVPLGSSFVFLWEVIKSRKKLSSVHFFF